MAWIQRVFPAWTKWLDAIGAAMGGHKPGDKMKMFETAFSPFWASWGLGVATARSAVKN